MKSATHAVIGCCLAGALTLTGCAAGAPDTISTTSGTELSLAAAFYPVQFVAERVGGELVSVSTLTAPGVDAHDLELSPAAVRDLGRADAVLYFAGFQAAVDSAVASTDIHAIDAGVTLDGEHGAGDDPHFWLAPLVLADFGNYVAAQLGELDPANARIYAAHANELEADLTALDSDFQEGLAECARTDVFVTHEAFGYLTERYGLSQHGLAGVDPESEPSPARVREIRTAIEASGATTIFSESLVSASALTSIAADAGVTTAVLDPIESAPRGDDYFTVMARNLEALRTGLDCD